MTSVLLATSTASSAGSDLAALAVTALIVGVVVGGFLLVRGRTMTFRSGVPLPEVMMKVSGLVNRRSHWRTTSMSENSATFEYETKPSGCLALLLMLFFLIPGIVYLVLGGKKESVSVYVADEGPERRVQVSSSGFTGNGVARSIRRNLASGSAARGASGQVAAIGVTYGRGEATSAVGPPPGWYVDPGGTGARRWWDGRQWTDHLDQS